MPSKNPEKKKVNKVDLLDQLAMKNSSVEEMVQNYVRMIGDINRNTIKHVRVTVPPFANAREKRAWEDEEVRRCREGYKNMTGKHYFYYNYCKMKHASGRISLPDWRRVDAEYFKMVEDCLRGPDRGKGIINVKRRRIGQSWKFTCIILHEAMFYPGSDLGMQSKSEDDVKILLNDKLKFIYSNLPQFLRSKTYGNNLMKLRFGITATDPQGNKIIKGNRSNIVCKSPTDTNWEGMGLKIWGVDEAGKTTGLKQIVSLTYPCLAAEDGLTMEGVPILFGTAGDMDKVGTDFHDLWQDAEAHSLVRHFTPGWAGLKLDDYGNEDVEAAVRWILEERKKKEGLSQREYYDFLQQYPLTVEEAFISYSDNEFDVVKLNIRKNELLDNPPKLQVGRFEWDDDEDAAVPVKWTPDEKNGFVTILEHPIRGLDSLYVTGSDPYDHKKKKDSGSSGSTCVYKRAYEPGEEEEEGSLMQMPVCMITDDGSNPTEFYTQSLMACIYYNESKILIEKNRAGMMNFFEDNGYQYLLKARPLKSNKIKFSASNIYEYGLFMDEDNKRYMMDCLRVYIDNNVEGIYFLSLIEDLLSYDPENQKKKSDKVDAFGIALIHARDRSLRVVARDDDDGNRAPSFTYKRGMGGKISRV